MFSIIIVTFNEVLLEKTYAVYSCLKTSVHNVLENTDPGYIYEVKLMVKGDKQVLIIDDHSDVPVTWDEKETRVRIIRNGSYFMTF